MNPTLRKLLLSLVVPAPLYAMWFSFWLWNYTGARQDAMSQWWSLPLFLSLFLLLLASCFAFYAAVSRLGELNEGIK